ncbi:DUF2490 domain-containing protein [Flavobacterium hiemivividum]|uniref:DUF2490 domain-containing protein n=1 Tax=Flavobacterium hiemivividum TaxID=2541734 RepID=A0A4R5CZS2_9FLAO|nr:DUF2490 domain-containing protein [Flavobacterium hiemivividum]TDE03465.1 DUF2490 domain-containing protein [Flavobacterium hiemivividum]
MKKSLIITFAMLLITLKGISQNTVHQYLTWTQAIMRIHPDSKFSYEGILQVRLLENLDNIQLISLTNGVYYKAGKKPFFLGADYSFITVNTGEQYRQIHWIQPKLEYRPKLDNINFLFRLMYAHLWIFDLNGPDYKSEDDRIRFLYQVSLPITKDLRLNLNDEIFILGRQSFMKENRFQCSISNRLDDRNTISVGYFFRWVGATNKIQKTLYENALTIAYTYTIPSKK